VLASAVLVLAGQNSLTAASQRLLGAEWPMNRLERYLFHSFAHRPAGLDLSIIR
jgi:hypothetical protein